MENENLVRKRHMYRSGYFWKYSKNHHYIWFLILFKTTQGIVGKRKSSKIV